MSHRWSAEITNDPALDYDLVIELLEDDRPRGRVYRDAAGKAILTVYECADKIEIDLDWLQTVVGQKPSASVLSVPHDPVTGSKPSL